MTERFQRQPIPRWYWLAAVASLLFMLFGCWEYLVDVTTDPASIPIDRRNMIIARPAWQVGAFAMAVWVGLLGTLLLLLRRRAAEPLMLVSLVAVFFWCLPLATIPAIRDNITVNDIAVAIGIVMITGSIWSFARHSRQQGWLR